MKSVRPSVIMVQFLLDSSPINMRKTTFKNSFEVTLLVKVLVKNWDDFASLAKEGGKLFYNYEELSRGMSLSGESITVMIEVLLLSDNAYLFREKKDMNSKEFESYVKEWDRKIKSLNLPVFRGKVEE